MSENTATAVYTVKDTVSQQVVTIEETENILTRADLEQALNSRGIGTEDMDIFEGLTRTSLIDGNSAIPRDVTYKGEVTNNLVFYLSRKNKKIKSGAGIPRAEVLARIKALIASNPDVKDEVGNYTQKSSALLLEVLEQYENVPTSQVVEQSVVSETSRASVSRDVYEALGIITEIIASELGWEDCGGSNEVITRLRTIVKNGGVEVTRVEVNTASSVESGVYSNSELDELAAGLGL